MGVVNFTVILHIVLKVLKIEEYERELVNTRQGSRRGLPQHVTV